MNQVLLSKIWYLAYVENPPADIIQNIRKDILDFLCNYRKVRVNRNTIMLSIGMGGLVITSKQGVGKARVGKTRS